MAKLRVRQPDGTIVEIPLSGSGGWGGSVTATDDGQGNVTIVSNGGGRVTATDDGQGNVTISN